MKAEERCCVCKKRKIHIKKWRMCLRCYNSERKKGHINTKPLKKPIYKKAKSIPRCYGKKAMLRKNAGYPFIPFTPYFVKGKEYNAKLGALKRFGVEFFDDLDRLEKSHMLTLQDVGTKYEITREYVRQLFKRIKGYPYTEPYLKLKEQRYNSDTGVCINDPRRKVADYKKGSGYYKKALATLEVVKRCQTLEYDVHPPCDNIYDLIINNYKINVVSVESARETSKNGRPYYLFAIFQRNSDFDFVIGYIFSIDCFYIFPRSSLDFSKYQRQKSIYIYMPYGVNDFQSRNKDYEEPKWINYKERWDLLKNHKNILH